MSSEVRSRNTPRGSAGNDTAIHVAGLSKCYQIYERPQHRLWQGLFRGRRQFFREFWALRDVSFDVQRGETVGIIGRNGSGKSTLLQLICGTLTPTAGTVEVNGRVSALLELGAGFNPEFTGRENAYLNAALLGFSRQQFDARFDGVAAFADIGEFLDQPVKTYSSGMFVRLAFAVAINVSPDILVVDEALAVGDMAFQAKCMARIREMRESGVTLLFVSHDIGAVKALCQRGVYLEGGRVISYGKAADVASLYVARSHMEINLALGAAPLPGTGETEIASGSASPAELADLPRDVALAVSTSESQDLGPDATRYGDRRVSVLDIKLLDASGRPVQQLEVDQPFELQIAVRANADLPDLAWGYSMRDLKGQMLVAMVSTVDPSCSTGPVKAGETLVVAICGTNALQPGVYTLAVGIELPVMANQQHAFLEVVEHALVFKSVWPADARQMFPGLVKVPASFTMLARSGLDERAGRARVSSAAGSAA